MSDRISLKELREALGALREDFMRVGLLAVSERVDGCVPRANGLRIREIVHSRCWPDDLALARFKDYEDA